MQLANLRRLHQLTRLPDGAFVPSEFHADAGWQLPFPAAIEVLVVEE
jgi:hypothetical protein